MGLIRKETRASGECGWRWRLEGWGGWPELALRIAWVVCERGNSVCVIETGGICWVATHLMTGLCDNTKGNDGKFSG